jgi:hypothetical protein
MDYVLRFTFHALVLRSDIITHVGLITKPNVGTRRQKMKVLPSALFQDNKPINPELESALLFASLSQPAIRQYLDSIESETKRIQTAQQDAEKGIQEGKRKKKSAYIIMGIVAGIGLILLLVGLFAAQSVYQRNGLVTLGILAIMVGVLVGISTLVGAKNKIKELQKQLEQWQERQDEVAKRPLPQTVTKLGKLHYSARVVPFEAGHIVLDSSGLLPKFEFTYPEITDGAARIEKLHADFSQLPEELPILLNPADPPPAPPKRGDDFSFSPQLVGLESDLRGILEQANQIFSDTEDIVASLAVYSNQSNFVRSLQQTSNLLKDGQVGMLLQKEEPELENIILRLSATREQAKVAQAAGGESLESLMEQIVQKVEGYLGQIKSVRDYSLSILSDDLRFMDKFYDYPMTRFYCPKCHEVAQWKRSFLPVAPERILEASEDDVARLPLGDELIKLRRHVDTLKRYVQTLRNAVPISKGPATDATDEQLSAVENKIGVLELTIQQILHQAINAADYSQAGEVVKRNAVLKYSLNQGRWKCQLCEAEFTNEEAQLGRLLKVKDDLMLPIWDTLWLEKSDEKNRIIREREAEKRNNKQNEAAQIRSEAQVFTEEWRQIRSSQETIRVQVEKARFQLDTMLNYYASQQMVSPATERQFRSMFSDSSMSAGANQLLAIADQLERQLESEPETVFLRRGDLMDYSLEVRNEGKYFRPMAKNVPELKE